MSVSLFVSLERPIALVELALLVSGTLREILNLEESIKVTAAFDLSDSMGHSEGKLLCADSKRVLCSIAGHDEQASVMPLKLPAKDDFYGNDLASYRDFVSIMWAYKKSPLNYALCAAVAAGIAVSQESEIHDNGGFYTMNSDPTPRDFLQTLTLPAPQADLEEAAAMLYARMPKSIEVAGGRVAQV